MQLDREQRHRFVGANLDKQERVSLAINERPMKRHTSRRGPLQRVAFRLMVRQPDGGAR